MTLNDILPSANCEAPRQTSVRPRSGVGNRRPAVLTRIATEKYTNRQTRFTLMSGSFFVICPCVDTESLVKKYPRN